MMTYCALFLLAYSSIAFDLDMWKQNDADLTEKIEEATHVEKEQKTILTQKSQELTVCIS